MGVKDNLINFLKGFILGIANIIPGVSGGTLAVSLNIYELILGSINNFFKDIKKNFNIILPILLGVVIAIITTSKVVTYALEHFKAQTIFLFIGLILGGLTLIFNKVKGKLKISNVVILLIMFAIVLCLNFIPFKVINISFSNMKVLDYLLILIMGFLASASMIIPGISGSFVLMIFGYYESIMSIISDITNLNHFKSNMLVLIPFGIGIVLGVLLMAKLISRLIAKHEKATYFGIIGFVLSSLIVLFFQIDTFNFTFLNILTCIITFAWGFALARAIEKE